MAGNSNRVFSYHVGAISRRKFNTAQIQLLSRRRAWITQFISFFSVFFFSARNKRRTLSSGITINRLAEEIRGYWLCHNVIYLIVPLIGSCPFRNPPSPPPLPAPRSPLPPHPSPLPPPPRRSIMASLFYLDRWKQLTGNQTLKIELIFWIVLFYSYFH